MESYILEILSFDINVISIRFEIICGIIYVGDNFHIYIHIKIESYDTNKH